MKIKSLLLLAAASIGFGAAANVDVPQGKLTAPDITITSETKGKLFVVPFTLTDLGTIHGGEDGYGHYPEGQNGNPPEMFEIGAEKMWKNIQFNMTFPEGVHPALVKEVFEDEIEEGQDNVSCLISYYDKRARQYVTEESFYVCTDDPAEGVYDLPGPDIAFNSQNFQCVTYSNNYDRDDFWPEHKTVGVNMTATLNPEGVIYYMFITVDENLENGTYPFKIFCKWIDQVDGANIIYTDDNRGTLFNVIVNREVAPTYRTITGVVKNEAGELLEGVTVTATPYGGDFEVLTTTTNAEGVFTFENALDNVNYTLRFDCEGYLSKDNVYEDDANEVTLQSVYRTITGVVKNEAGIPLPGVTVTADPKALGAEPLTTTTNAEGVFTFDNALRNFAYTLNFNLDGYEPKENVAEVETEVVILHFVRRSLSGLVVDQDNQPLSGVSVTAYTSGEGAEELTTITNAEGAYSFDQMIAIYHYTLDFVLEDYVPNREVDEADAALVIMQSFHKTITGVVKNEDGEPLEGVTVTAIPQAVGADVLTTTTNAEGVYTIDNAFFDYPYNLKFVLEGYVTQSGLDEDVAVVVMQRATRIISGYVYDSETHEPLEGVTVSASLRPVDGLMLAPGDLSATTDATGKFEIEVPYEGVYGLSFSKEGYLTQDIIETEIANGIYMITDPDTGIYDINGSSNAESVIYINAAGMVSDKAFDGMNIVVTKHADGTQSIVKILK